MKRIIALVVIVSVMFVSCGVSTTINGKVRNPVGLISMNCDLGDYSKTIHYEPCWGNIIWGAILSETIIAPIYFYGFSCFNPISIKDSTNN